MAKDKGNVPATGTKWQDWAAPSVVKDDEKEAKKEAPPQDSPVEKQNTPESNWPY